MCVPWLVLRCVVSIKMYANKIISFAKKKNSLNEAPSFEDRAKKCNGSLPSALANFHNSLEIARCNKGRHMWPGKATAISPNMTCILFQFYLFHSYWLRLFSGYMVRSCIIFITTTPQETYLSDSNGRSCCISSSYPQLWGQHLFCAAVIHYLDAIGWYRISLSLHSNQNICVMSWSTRSLSTHSQITDGCCW